MAHGGRARGRWGGCGSNKSALVHFFRLPSRPNNWSDLAGDEGGGMEGGQGGRGGGSSVGATKDALVPSFVTRVGGWGEAWGGSPWRAGKGGDGGAPESSALVP